MQEDGNKKIDEQAKKAAGFPLYFLKVKGGLEEIEFRRKNNIADPTSWKNVHKPSLDHQDFTSPFLLPTIASPLNQSQSIPVDDSDINSGLIKKRGQALEKKK
jgi:hypothetical protein